MDDVTITVVASSVAAILFCCYGILPLLKIFIFCTVILALLYLFLMSNSVVPSDLLYHYIYPTKLIQSNHEKKRPVEYDDEITKKLRELSTHIVQDFILSWYKTVTDDVTFVQDAFEVFEHICNHSRRKIACVDREKLLNSILVEFTNHVIAYKNATAKVEKKFANRSDKDWRNHHIAVSYSEESSSHPAMMAFPISELEYLRGIALLLLKEVLPENYFLSDTALYLVRELIVQNVLLTLVEMLCDPLYVMNFIKEVLSEENDERPPDDVGNAEHSAMSDNMTEDAATDVKFEDSSFNMTESITTSENCTSSILSRGTHGNGCLQSTAEHADSLACGSTVARSSSMASNASDESSGLQASETDIPLPLQSTELHFAPEGSAINIEQAPNLLAISDSHEKFFHRIRIGEVTIMKEAYDAKKRYSLYKITYVTKEDCLQVDGMKELTSDSAHQEETVTKKHQVQRRFREFLALQERLSQNTMAKTLISNIKGPSRMFPVPFGNMDNEYVEQRKKFLQAYLREISSIPYVSRTKELREFLAYESDPRIAYVTKPEPMPRFDKIFRSAIQDLLGSTTMKFSQINMPDDNMLQTGDDEKARSSASSQSLASTEIENVGAVAKLKNKVFGTIKNLETDNHIIANTSRQFAEFQPHESVFKSSWKKQEKIDLLSRCGSEHRVEGRLSMRGFGDGCDSVNYDDKTRTQPFALSAELIFKLVCHNWNMAGGQTCLATLTLKRYLQLYMDSKTAELTSDKAWTKYLTVLIESLWPHGEWRSDNGPKQTWSTITEEKKLEIMTSVEQCLKTEIPRGLRYLVGEATFDIGITRLVRSFQDCRLNRQLFYSLLDVLLKEIFQPLQQSDARPDVTLNFISD